MIRNRGRFTSLIIQGCQEKGRIERSKIIALTLLACSTFVVGVRDCRAATWEYGFCDGFKEATGAGDNVTRTPNSFLGIPAPFNPSIERVNIGSGAEAIQACNKALADLSPSYLVRRVSLLRARAAHKIEANDIEGAISDLDAADAVGKTVSDPFFDRSFKLGVSLVRAFALGAKGDLTTATSEAASAHDLRPYSPEIARAAVLASGEQLGDPVALRLQQDMAKLWPEMINDLFLNSLRSGDYSEALKLYPQLTPPQKPMDGFYDDMSELEHDLENKRLAQAFWATMTGAVAYVCASQNQPEVARQYIASAAARLKAATQDPPPLPPNANHDAERRRTLSINYSVRMNAEISPLISQWRDAVEQRLKIAQDGGETYLNQSNGKSGMRDWMGLDVLNALTAGHAERRELVAQAAALKRDLEKPRFGSREVKALLESLPDAETPERRPAYRQAGKNLLIQRVVEDALGYQDIGPDPNGVRTVRMRGNSSTAPILEEMALLRAAELVRASGGRGFIILGRRITQFKTVTRQYGRIVRVDNMGYSAAFDILPVDPSALPRPYNESPWRVIDPEQVYEALAPIYIQTRSAAK